MSAPDKAPALSVLVAVAEAAPHLAEVHVELLHELDGLELDYEVIYLLAPGIARGPARAVVRGLCASRPERVRVLEFAQDVGEGAMLRAGCERARGEWLATVPPRFETQLGALRRLVAALRDGADLVVASRARGRSDAAARAQSRLFNRVVSWTTGSRFHDIASGTRVMRREVLEEIVLYGDFHRYLPLLAERAGFDVREIAAEGHARASAPVVHRPRVYLWRAMDVLSMLFVSRFTRNPLRLFGGVGSVFALAGFAILGVLAVQRLLGGEPLANRPILVLAVLLVGLGVQAVSIGLLGELILFFRGRTQRDYRVGAVHEPSIPPLPERDAGGSP